jgi:hypothetical protein
MQPSAQPLAGIVVATLIVVSVPVALLAWLNFRARRGDIRGAGRLAAFVFVAEILEWVCTAHHVSSTVELALFIGGVSGAALAAGFVWMLYLALEPYVRRRWPQIMITWSRLLAGGFRDPLVGGHLLVGVALGIALALCYLLEARYGSFVFFDDQTLISVLDARHMAGGILSLLIGTTIVADLFLVFLFFLLRVLLCRQWLAALVFILLSGVAGLQSSHPVISILFTALILGFFVANLLWFGVLPTLVTGFVGILLRDFVLTTDLSAWYAGTTVAAVAIVLALTAYAFHTAVAGRPLFKAGFLEPD